MVSRILLHSLDAAVTDAFVREALHLWAAPQEDDQPQPAATRGNCTATPQAAAPATPSHPAPATLPTLPTLEENERAHIRRALAATGGKIAGPHGAAALLGVPRSTLQHRMRKLGLAATS